MVNQNRINNIVGFVRYLIDLRGLSDSLTDEKVNELIAEAIGFIGVSCPDEEREACRRELTYRIMTRMSGTRKSRISWNRNSG